MSDDEDCVSESEFLNDFDVEKDIERQKWEARGENERIMELMIKEREEEWKREKDIWMEQVEREGREENGKGRNADESEMQGMDVRNQTDRGKRSPAENGKNKKGRKTGRRKGKGRMNDVDVRIKKTKGKKAKGVYEDEDDVDSVDDNKGRVKTRKRQIKTKGI